MMNNIVSYQSNIHEKDFINWLQAWKLSTQILKYLPETGFVIPGKCISFIYHLNKNLCQFEGLVVNPTLDRQERDQVLWELTDYMQVWAKQQGYQEVMFYTNNLSMFKKSQSTGWTISKQTYHVLTKDL